MNRKIRARRRPALPNAEPSSRDRIPTEESAARGPGTEPRCDSRAEQGKVHRDRTVHTAGRYGRAARCRTSDPGSRSRPKQGSAATATARPRPAAPAPGPPPPRSLPRLTCARRRKRGGPAAPQEQRQQDGEPGRADPPPPGRRAEPLVPPHVLRRRPAAQRRSRGWRLSASPRSSCGSRCPPPPRRGPPRHRRPRSAHTAPPAVAAAAIFRATWPRGAGASPTDGRPRQSTRATRLGGGTAGRDGADPRLTSRSANRAVRVESGRARAAAQERCGALGNRRARATPRGGGACHGLKEPRTNRPAARARGRGSGRRLSEPCAGRSAALPGWLCRAPSVRREDAGCVTQWPAFSDVFELAFLPPEISEFNHNVGDDLPLF